MQSSRFFYVIVVALLCFQKEAAPMMGRFALMPKRSFKKPQFTFNNFTQPQQRTFHGTFDDPEKCSWLRKEQLRLLAQKIGSSTSEVKRLIKKQSIDFAEDQAMFWLLQKDKPEDILLDYLSIEESSRLGNFSKSPLWYAVELNNNAAFDALIKICYNDANTSDDEGRTILIRALWHRNVHMVKGLLKAGANPNVYYSEKRCGEEVFKVTPLRVAVAQRNLRMTKKLLKYGAKVTYPYPEYKQELISLAMYQYPDNLYGGETDKISDPCKIEKIVELLEKADLEPFRSLIKGWYHQD